MLYARVLEEIAGRVEAVRRTLLPPDPTPPNIELSALHLRKILELIVMGSLVTNRTEIEAITKALQRKKAREARELAKTANPDYWPKGTKPFKPMNGTIEIQAVEGALREDEWDRVYGHLSELLHARNPYKSPIDLPKERVWLAQVRNKIMSLLEHHIITLVDRDYFLIGLMRTTEGTVQVSHLHETGRPQPPPSKSRARAWLRCAPHFEGHQKTVSTPKSGPARAVTFMVLMYVLE